MTYSIYPLLKKARRERTLTVQQYKTLMGQAKKGQFETAEKGLNKMFSNEVS